MYRRFSILRAHAGAKAMVLAAGFATLGAVSFPGEAAAAVNANFQGYCNTYFPNSTYQMQFTRWGPRHFCRRAGGTYGYVLQGVTPNAVCYWQTGNSAYRQSGQYVLCNGRVARTQANPYYVRRNPAPQVNRQPARRAVSPNLSAYCARTHYGSAANFSYQLNSWICTQRSGRYSLRHYRVNFNQACYMTTGRTSYRFVGDRRTVVCT